MVLVTTPRTMQATPAAPSAILTDIGAVFMKIPMATGMRPRAPSFKPFRKSWRAPTCKPFVSIAASLKFENVGGADGGPPLLYPDVEISFFTTGIPPPHSRPLPFYLARPLPCRGVEKHCGGP